MRFYSKDGYKLRQFKNVREVEEQLRLPLFQDPQEQKSF